MGNYTHEGVEYPSITTICGILAKPHLIQWAADMATDFILDHIDEIIAEDNVHHRKDLIDRARHAHDDYRKLTANIGTQAHEAIEEYIKSDNEQVSACASEVQDVFSSFLDWCGQYNPVWLASEHSLYSIHMGVAGVCDALAMINDELWMVDFKTSKKVYPKDYSLQLAGYAESYKERGETFGPVKRYVILHLDWREGLVNTVDVTKKIPDMVRSYRLLSDFYYSYAKRRLKNPRVKEYYP